MQEKGGADVVFSVDARKLEGTFGDASSKGKMKKAKRKQKRKQQKKRRRTDAGSVDALDEDEEDDDESDFDDNDSHRTEFARIIFNFPHTGTFSAAGGGVHFGVGASENKHASLGLGIVARVVPAEQCAIYLSLIHI